MVIINRRNNQRIVTAKHTGDIEFWSQSSDPCSVLDKESIPVIGPWKDQTGSKDVNSAAQQHFAGLSNALHGTLAGFLGEDLDQLNKVGQNKQTIRRRRFKDYVKFY